MKKNIFLSIFWLAALNPLLSQDLKYVSTLEGKAKSAYPFSLAVWAGDFCYLAGQIGTDATTGKLPTDFKEEVTQTLKNLQAILKSQKLDFNNVAKATIFLKDINDFAAMNEVYRTFFPDGHFPARETVQVAGLVLGARVEITMTAYKKRRKY